MQIMKRAVVTGAAGFAGCNLTEHLLQKGYEVVAVVRPNSPHNARLYEIQNDKLSIVRLDISDISQLPKHIEKKDIDAFFHLAWEGERDDKKRQENNVNNTMEAILTASKLNCRKFICTGSQAEYGLQGTIEESKRCMELPPKDYDKAFNRTTESAALYPLTAYGRGKAEACYITRRMAENLGIEWIWVRIFSLYGKYEPRGRMLPDLIASIKEGKPMKLSSCIQLWDFLDAGDAANGIIAAAEHGRSGEIYNLSNGNTRLLKDFTNTALRTFCTSSAADELIIYGDDADPFISLKPSNDKLCRDTGWKPEVEFSYGIAHSYEKAGN